MTRDKSRNANGDLPKTVKRKKVMMKAAAGDPTALNAIRAADKVATDNSRDENGDLPDTVKRNEAKKKVDALNAIRATDNTNMAMRLARWTIEAAAGDEEAIVKLAAYHGGHAPRTISGARWDEIIVNVSPNICDV